MYNTRVKFALDQFIKEDCFSDTSNLYHLREEQDSGKSDLVLKISNENLCICNFDEQNKGRCTFLREEKKYGMQKSVDHVIFEKTAKGWRLHLIEMKSTVGYGTWIGKIRPKVRTSYFTALAIADFLGIQFYESIAYTTYENDKFAMGNQEENPRGLVPLLGYAARDPYKDEWNKDKIILNVGEELILQHKRVLMTRNAATEVLEGELTI